MMEVRDEVKPDIAPPPNKVMTYEEFLQWVDEDTWAEWVDGKVEIMSPASLRHQHIVDFLAAIIRHFIEEHQLGDVITAPFQMKTAPDLPGREPDILFIARENMHRLKDTHLDGPADLVVEVVSPESRSKDRGTKFYEYEQGGVREYWLIDPLRKQAEFYQLGADGVYHIVPVGEDGIYRSMVLQGFWLRIDWLWQEPPPSITSVIKELGLI